MGKFRESNARLLQKVEIDAGSHDQYTKNLLSFDSFCLSTGNLELISPHTRA